jgi:hypothetical protein
VLKDVAPGGMRMCALFQRSRGVCIAYRVLLEMLMRENRADFLKTMYLFKIKRERSMKKWIIAIVIFLVCLGVFYQLGSMVLERRGEPAAISIRVGDAVQLNDLIVKHKLEKGIVVIGTPGGIGLPMNWEIKNYKLR